MSSNKYSKLSDEILFKKISTMKTQSATLVDFITQHDDTYSYSIPLLTECYSRIDLENICDELSVTINTLKAKQKDILDNIQEQERQKEKEKQQEDDVKETKVVYDKLTDLNDLKRSFFNPNNTDFKPFSDVINEQQFHFYKGVYKYSADMNGKLDYMARNFNKSFIKRLEDFSDYLFVCFKCKSDVPGEYVYESYWLFNSIGKFEQDIIDENDDIQFENITQGTFILGSLKLSDDFDVLYLH